MAGKGGPNPGAGRPKGAVNAITVDLRDKIEKAGVIDFLIDVYNGKPIKSKKKGEEDQVPTLSMRVDVAQFLTKKIVPDLKAMELSVGDNSGYESLVERLAKKESERKIKDVN